MRDGTAGSGMGLEMATNQASLSPWLDAIPFAVLTVDGDLRIVNGNVASDEMFHWRAEESGHLLAYLASRADVIRLQDAHDEARRSGQGRCECRLRHWNRTVLPARLTIRPLGRSTPHCLITIEDATVCLTATEEMLRLQRLSTMGKLACGIGHDLANLMMVLGYRFAKIEPALAGHAEALKSFQETIKAAGTAQELARRMVYLGREHRSHARAVDVSAAVRQAMSLLRGTLGSGIQTVVACPAHGMMIWCDPIQLEQVLLNLILNAREAIPDSGMIAASVTRIERREGDGLGEGGPRDERGGVSVAIKDDGCGMAPEVQARIFDPFFTTKESGTGMGLTVVQRGVQEMGGRLCVHSQLGQGTTMEVQLPVYEESPEGA